LLLKASQSKVGTAKKQWYSELKVIVVLRQSSLY